MIKRLILSASFCLFISTGAHAFEPVTPEISNAYAYATTGSQKNGAAFLSITGAMSNDKILEAKSDVAERTELHTHLMENGRMMMRKVDAFSIQEDGTLQLKPTGDHIMLMNLKAPLELGESFPLTLVFENSGAHEVNVNIIAPGTKPETTTHEANEHETGHSHH
tara:strand:+ start:161 stop:655 length:495 start_codon:yes stop_codon:yes gene_type:complete